MLNFFEINFFEKLLQENRQSVKQIGSRSGPTFCRPDLGPNCLQKLSADNTRGQRVKDLQTNVIFHRATTISWDGPLHILRGHRLQFPNLLYFFI